MSNAELNSQSYLLSKATINGSPINGDFILVDDKRAGNAWCKNVSGQVVTNISQYFKLADITLPPGSVVKFTLYAGYGDGAVQAGKTEVIIRRNSEGAVGLRLIDGTQIVLSVLYVKKITGDDYRLYSKLQSAEIGDGFLEYNWSSKASVDTESVWTFDDGLLPSDATAALPENRWLGLELLNGFIAYGESYQMPQFMLKDSHISLQGLVKYPSNWSATLPLARFDSQYAPANNHLFTCANSGGARRVDVQDLGNVLPSSTDSPGATISYLSLNGIRWRAKG